MSKKLNYLGYTYTRQIKASISAAQYFVNGGFAAVAISLLVPPTLEP